MLSSTTRITGSSDRCRVVHYVALVLDVLDDRDQDPNVALPQEHRSISLPDCGPRKSLLRSRRRARPREYPVQPARTCRASWAASISPTSRFVTIKVESTVIFPRHRHRFAPLETCVIPESRWCSSSDSSIRSSLRTSVLAQNEGIVQARHQQDVAHPEGHQFVESFKHSSGAS